MTRTRNPLSVRRLGEPQALADPAPLQERAPPRLVREIPVDRSRQAFRQSDARPPAKLFSDLRGVDGVTEIVARAVRDELNQLEVRLQALEMTSLRILTEADAGEQIGAEPSMLKLKGSELVQAQDELLFRLIDYLALPQDTKDSSREAVEPFAEYIASGRYHHRGYTIAGGSSEVQHNIIAKQVLGL